MAILVAFPHVFRHFSSGEIGGNELVAVGAAVEAIWMRVLVCASVVGLDLVGESANHCLAVGRWGGAGGHWLPLALGVEAGVCRAYVACPAHWNGCDRMFAVADLFWLVSSHWTLF